jgi:tRNA threonylcarbamoyl adenosine modification protein YjeE
MSSIFFNHPIELESLATLEAVLEGIIPFIKNKDVIFFEGPLGAGKTTSARFIIQALVGEKIDVPSPTFNLVHTYDAQDFPLWHFDLYRLKNEEELFDIGIEEALSHGVLMIEWPEKGGQILPPLTLKLQFHFGENGTRFLTLIPSIEWSERIKNDAF